MNRIKELAKDYVAKRIVLFGSFWKNAENASDQDIACDIPRLKLLAFTGAVESDLRIDVDVLYLSNLSILLWSI